MKAMLVEGPRESHIVEDVELDEPLDAEVVVRVRAAGVCHSDLHFYQGDSPWPMPTVLGHEMAGVVERVGRGVTYVSPGDHVVGCLSVFCGTCDWCLSGRPYRCANPITSRTSDQPSRLSRHGHPINQFAHLSSFAELCLVHENALVKIPADVPMSSAAPLGCAVISGVGAAVNTAKVHPGSTVAVFGMGAIGLSVVQGARIAGASRIIAVDLLASKLSIAERFGATDVVNASTDDPVAAIRDLTEGGVGYSFEAIGRPSTILQALESSAPSGTTTVIGLVPAGTKMEIEPRWLISDRKLQGCGMGSNRFRLEIPWLIDLYRQGRLLLDEMVTATMPLEGLDDAYEALENGTAIRTVIVPD